MKMFKIAVLKWLGQGTRMEFNEEGLGWVNSVLKDLKTLEVKAWWKKVRGRVKEIIVGGGGGGWGPTKGGGGPEEEEKS